MVRFLHDNVESIEQLEVLRVLAEDRRRLWDLNSLAHTVQADFRVVRGHLAVLRDRGLVEMTARSNGLFCRYGIRSPELEDMTRRLLVLYRERPVTMIKLVYERTGAPH